MNKDNEKQLFEKEVIDEMDEIQLIADLEDMDDSFLCCFLGGGHGKED